MTANMSNITLHRRWTIFFVSVYHSNMSPQLQGGGGGEGEGGDTDSESYSKNITKYEGTK